MSKKMSYTKQEKILIITNILFILGFSIIFYMCANYEFILYVGVLIALMSIVLYSHRFFRYSIALLWALTIWSLMHLIGGGMEYAPGEVFYKLMLIPLIDAPYSVLKYDQVVHFFGFWTTTILLYYVIMPFLKTNSLSLAIILIVVMASLGLSAVNEIVEFIATVVVPDTNVGGYENTAIDLVSNFFGACGAGVYLKYKNIKLYG